MPILRFPPSALARAVGREGSGEQSRSANSMNPLPYLPALVAALAAAVCGVLFTLSFTAWLLCEHAARVGRYAPLTWLFLALFTLLCSLTYTLAP